MNTILTEFVVSIVLAGHLICMNLASALPLLCLLLQWQTRHDNDSPALSTLRSLAWISIGALLLGSLMGIGVAAVMWLQHDRALVDVLPRFERKIYWGLAELVVYLAALGLYLRLLPSAKPARRTVWWTSIFLAFAAATNLLYHFPPLFGVMVMVSHAPEMASESITVDEFRRLMMTGKVMSLTVHFWLASLALGAIFAAHFVLRSLPNQPLTKSISAFVRWTSGIALATTAVQILVGTWVLVQIGPVAQNRLLGGDWIATTLLAAALLMVFALLQRLAELSFSPPDKGKTRQALLWMILVILLMTGSLRFAERIKSAGPVTALTRLSAVCRQTL